METPCILMRVTGGLITVEIESGLLLAPAVLEIQHQLQNKLC